MNVWSVEYEQFEDFAAVEEFQDPEQFPELGEGKSLVQYSTSMTKRFGHGTCKFGHGTLFYDQLMTKLNWSQKLRHIWSTMTNRSFLS
jgi:hypothetical protein